MWVQEGYARSREQFWAPVYQRRARLESPRYRRRAKLVAWTTFAFAVALPVLLWHDMLAGIVSEFRLEWHYLLSEWTPWTLIACGLAFFAPVAWSAGVDPESRWYPRARSAYAGWGVTLYLLGMLLGMQVAQIYELHVR